MNFNQKNPNVLSSTHHIPKILHTPKGCFSAHKHTARSSIIPKHDLEKSLDDYHKQRINNLIKDSPSDFVRNQKKLQKNTRKSEAFIEKELASLSSLNEKELFLLALETLQKPSEQRDEFDIKVIFLSTENVKFFQDYGPQTHLECCRYMNCEHWKSQSILFQIGSIGTKFFIILKGFVGVWVNLPKIILDEKGKAIEQNEIVLTEVKTLGPGSSFGELALLDNRMRSAMIKCKEECEFAVLDKKHFNEILKEKEMKKLYENVDFLANIQVFHGFSFSSLKSLYYHTYEMKTIRKQVIYSKGDNPNSIYIIRDGEFLMTINVEMPKEEEGNSMKKAIRPMELALFSKGHIFGEEEIIDKTERKTTVVCVSHSAVLYVLAKKEFYRRVFLEDYSRVFLKENLKIKKKFREERIREFIETDKLCLLPKSQDLFQISSKNDAEIEQKEQKNQKEKKEQNEQKGQKKGVGDRVALKMSLLEEMQKTFVNSESVKAQAYERYRAVKAKYPIQEISVDMQEIMKKKMLDETLLTPYLRAFLKKKTESVELKRKIEIKETKRKFAMFFQEKAKEERENKKGENNVSIFSNINEEIKCSSYDSLVFSEIKEEKRKKDPFRKIKSISMHQKEEKNEMFPLKYQVKEIIKRKIGRVLPRFAKHFRGLST